MTAPHSLAVTTHASLTHSLAHSRTHAPMHSRTHALTHSVSLTNPNPPTKPFKQASTQIKHTRFYLSNEGNRTNQDSKQVLGKKQEVGSWMDSSIHSLIHPSLILDDFVSHPTHPTHPSSHSVTHSFMHSSIRLLVRSFIHSFIHSAARSANKNQHSHDTTNDHPPTHHTHHTQPN